MGDDRYAGCWNCGAKQIAITVHGHEGWPDEFGWCEIDARYDLCMPCAVELGHMKDYGRFSLEQVIQALKNSGVDETCGSCMSVAFTGATLAPHTCRDYDGFPKEPSQ